MIFFYPLREILIAMAHLGNSDRHGSPGKGYSSRKSSATHPCRCVQCYPSLPVCAVLPIPAGVCSATHPYRCVQCYPSLPVCAVLPIPTGVCSATHPYRCVQCYPSLPVCAVLPIPTGVCSIFVCPSSALCAVIFNVRRAADTSVCDCAQGLSTLL